MLKDVEKRMDKKIDYAKWQPIKEEFTLQFDNFYTSILGKWSYTTLELKGH